MAGFGGCRGFVYGFSQCFARFEADGSRQRDRDAIAISWIATDAGWSMCDGKTSKSTDFYSMTGYQCILQGIKKGVDGKLCVVLGQVDKARRQFVDEVRAVHCPIVT